MVGFKDLREGSGNRKEDNKMEVHGKDEVGQTNNQ